MNLNKYIFILFLYFFSFGAYAAKNSLLSMNNHLDYVIQDVCNKKVVLLGEDAHHGSGKTLEVKVILVKRLIDECGFSAVFFESSVYEFLNLQHEISLKSSSTQNLSQSIGGLWASAKSMLPLISYLHEKAINGEVRLAGIDSQFSANQPFSQKILPAKLARYLPEIRGKACGIELYQYLNWQYDDAHPYNENTKKRISLCVAEIRKNMQQKKFKAKSFDEDKFMIDNFARYLEFPLGNYFNLRDKAMADNFNWHVSHLPPNTKVIVWCATVHAARTLVPISKTKIPMGAYIHQSLKDQVVSIGFSALSGHFGRSKSQIKTIKTSKLEQKTLLNQSKNMIYLNKKQIQAYGEISAQAIEYNNIKKLKWDEILDGVIVLRREVPLEYQ